MFLYAASQKDLPISSGSKYLLEHRSRRSEENLEYSFCHIPYVPPYVVISIKERGYCIHGCRTALINIRPKVNVNLILKFNQLYIQKLAISDCPHRKGRFNIFQIL